jgi:hypothetical protein
VYQGNSLKRYQVTILFSYFCDKIDRHHIINYNYLMMKNIFAIVLLILISVSCVTTKQASLTEDRLFQTRKYVGIFLDYRHTEPERLGDPNLIWIKTTMEDNYGKISAYSKDCKFTKGERLFLRRIYYSPGGISGYWIYQVESGDESVSYRLSEYQYDKKFLVQTLF